MRVIKNSAVQYKSFHESIPSLNNRNADNENLKLLNFSEPGIENDYLLRLTNLSNEIACCTERESVFNIVRRAVNNIFNVSSDNLVLFIDNKLNALKKNDSYLTNYIINLNKEGVLDWIYESSRTKVLDHKSGSIIIIPLMNGNKKAGIYAALSEIKKEDIINKETEIQFLTILVNYAFQKSESIRAELELKSLSEAVQSLQSKLINEIKYTSIGKITTGFSQTILNSLQIILSSADMIHNRGNDSTINEIKFHINKIDNEVKRVLKYSQRNDEKIKLRSCRLNDLVNEYIQLSSASLLMEKIECLLDLDENLPVILSHDDYLRQILVNTMLLIKETMNNGGGIYIQTRYAAEQVTLRFIITSSLAGLQEKINGGRGDANLEQLKRMMIKHDGKIQIQLKKDSSSIINFLFPIKRKIL